MVVTVLLTILKIILWILGIVLGIVLLLLFVPFHYEISFSHKEGEEMSFAASFGDFIRFFRLSYEKTDEKYDLCVWLFWRLWQVLPKKEKESAPEEFDATEVLDEEEIRDILEDKEVAELSKEEKAALHKNLQKESNEEEASSPPPETKEHPTGKKKQKRKKSRQKQDNPALDFLKSLKEEKNREALTFLIRKVLWLLQKIRPRAMEADLSFSLGESDLTGLLVGAISLWPVAYDKKVEIAPDFLSEEAYFDGEAKIKGFVFLFHIVYLIVSSLMKKEIRDLIKR